MTSKKVTKLTSHLVKINNLCKSYKQDHKEQCILKNLDFTVKKGEFVVIMGKSGSGKTTLLNLMGLLDSFDEGTYIYEGLDVSLFKDNDCSAFRNKNIGFVFQQFHLIDSLTVFQNVELPLIYHGGYTYAERIEIVKKSLKAVGLEHKFRSYPNQLSGGQQQRVSIARAIVCQPNLILCDEPTGALDSETGLQIIELLLELKKQGKTIVMVTHDEDLKKLATQCLYLKDGVFIKRNYK
jgi:putative ABC transport system ATP-binding protein